MVLSFGRLQFLPTTESLQGAELTKGQEDATPEDVDSRDTKGVTPGVPKKDSRASH